MSDKRQQLLTLAGRRQRACWPGYHALAEYHGGGYECDFVSPYSKSAGNPDAEILVLLQDWSSHDDMSKAFDPEAASLGYTPRFPTNRNLIRLLLETFGKELKDVYVTNLFPFIKPGGISAHIPVRDLERAAQEFALPQIRIVQPLLVVCLGLAVFSTIQRVCRATPSRTLAEAIDSPFWLDRSRVWCQAHTGAFGQNNRGRERVSQDWLRMKSDVGRSLTSGCS
jgi:hypothetical protein